MLGLIVCFSGRANAQVTVSKYRDICQEYLDGKVSSDAGLCAGFAAGFIEGISGMNLYLDNGSICTVTFADGVTAKQLVKVVVAYIDKHPEILHKSVGAAFVPAIVEAELFVYTPVDKQPVVRARQ